MLADLLAMVAMAVAVDSIRESGPPAVALLDDSQTWQRLPKTVAGGGGKAPIWARALASRLPRTTAAMLVLDHAQRTKSPLPAKLRAKARWVVALANRCSYSQAIALADLRAAGADDGEIGVLVGPNDDWPAEERDVLSFAHMHSVAAPTISDAHFARLRKQLGDRGVAALVLLGAYGNFQDRIVLGLNLPDEQGGALSPAAVVFVDGTFQRTPVIPEQPTPSKLIDGGALVVEPDPTWSAVGFDQLQRRLEEQRSRPCRLPIPTWDEVKKGLPADLAARPTRISWNLVCSGYAPELAVPWSITTRTMWVEAKNDRVFEESLFWVQTRAVECNYCMGHCEMLLELAGLEKAEVLERTRRLAGDDWSCFPPAEQRAYAYARKLSTTPWKLKPADYHLLEKDLGPERALATFWWLCRGLYMTRISDGFQLPLERDNVFADYAKPKTDGKK